MPGWRRGCIWVKERMYIMGEGEGVYAWVKERMYMPG